MTCENHDKIIMPKALTYENGAKKALIGEFYEEEMISCPNCEGDRPANCDLCEGDGLVNIKLFVSWSTIKAIYKMAVKLLGQPCNSDNGFKIRRCMDISGFTKDELSALELFLKRLNTCDITAKAENGEQDYAMCRAISKLRKMLVTDICRVNSDQKI